jgi:hypothetical protein
MTGQRDNYRTRIYISHMGCESLGSAREGMKHMLKRLDILLGEDVIGNYYLNILYNQESIDDTFLSENVIIQSIENKWPAIFLNLSLKIDLT